MATTKVFKSGNSVAVRLPKVLGLQAGTEMVVREERGRYILEPVKKPDSIDLSGIYGSKPGLKPISPEQIELDDSPRDWHLLGIHEP